MSVTGKSISLNARRAAGKRALQVVITSGIGGENIAENIEGRERYPIYVRYALDFRDDIQKLERVVIATPSNAQVPLSLHVLVHGAPLSTNPAKA